MVAVVVLLIPARVPAAMAALGLLCVALAAVKINVGALAGVSIVFACALTSPWLRPVTVVRWGAIALFVLVPFALMRVDLGEENTLRWALIVAAGAIALSLIAVWQGQGTRPRRRDLAWLLGGGAGMLLLVSLVPIALGTSPGGLIDGWLIRPTEHPVIAFVPLPIDELGLLWALLGLIGASASDDRARREAGGVARMGGLRRRPAARRSADLAQPGHAGARAVGRVHPGDRDRLAAGLAGGGQPAGRGPRAALRPRAAAGPGATADAARLSGSGRPAGLGASCCS